MTGVSHYTCTYPYIKSQRPRVAAANMVEGETEGNRGLNEHRSHHHFQLSYGWRLWSPLPPTRSTSIRCCLWEAWLYFFLGDCLMNKGQTFSPFRKEQKYAITWINMLPVFHELALQGSVMLHGLFMNLSHIVPLSFSPAPLMFWICNLTVLKWQVTPGEV